MPLIDLPHPDQERPEPEHDHASQHPVLQWLLTDTHSAQVLYVLQPKYQTGERERVTGPSLLAAILHAMGAFTNKHPVELTQLIGTAIANGASTAQVHRDLSAGTFQGWNAPYPMPLETVRAYGKKERNRRTSKTITPEVRDNPKKVVDDLARLLLSKAQRGAEAAANNDPKALKDWGDALKTLSALVSDQGNAKPSGKRTKPPTDLLTQRLTAQPTNPSLPGAQPADKEPGPSREPADTEQHNQPQDKPHHSAGFLHGSPSWAA